MLSFLNTILNGVGSKGTQVILATKKLTNSQIGVVKSHKAFVLSPSTDEVTFNYKLTCINKFFLYNKFSQIARLAQW